MAAAFVRRGGPVAPPLRVLRTRFRDAQRRSPPAGSPLSSCPSFPLRYARGPSPRLVPAFLLGPRPWSCPRFPGLRAAPALRACAALGAAGLMPPSRRGGRSSRRGALGPRQWRGPFAAPRPPSRLSAPRLPPCRAAMLPRCRAALCVPVCARAPRGRCGAIFAAPRQHSLPQNRYILMLLARLAPTYSAHRPTCSCLKYSTTAAAVSLLTAERVTFQTLLSHFVLLPRRWRRPRHTSGKRCFSLAYTLITSLYSRSPPLSGTSYSLRAGVYGVRRYSTRRGPRCSAGPPAQ